MNCLHCSRLPDEAILWRISLFRRSRERFLPHHTQWPHFDKTCAFDGSLLFRSLAEVPHMFPSCSSPAIFRHLTPLISILMIRPLRFYLLLHFQSSFTSHLSFAPVRTSPRTSPHSPNCFLDRSTPVRRCFLLPRTVIPFCRSHSSIHSPA